MYVARRRCVQPGGGPLGQTELACKIGICAANLRSLGDLRFLAFRHGHSHDHCVSLRIFKIVANRSTTFRMTHTRRLQNTT